MKLKVLSILIFYFLLQESIAQNDSLLSDKKYCPAFADNRFILRGVIYDSLSNEELPVATVFVKGTKIGALSDDKGLFALDVTKLVDSTKTITIVGSYVGYKIKQIVINDVWTLRSYLPIPMVSKSGISCPGLDALPEKKKAKSKKRNSE